jgi:cobalt-zinc-cadmium efflux system outer membrane protein
MFGVLVIATTLRAQTAGTILTLQDALARARQTPVVTAANAGVTEAEANLRSELRLLRENPSLDVSAGPRRSPNGTTLQQTVSVEQPFEIGGRRAARIERAQADLDTATAERDATVQRYLRDVALAFVAAADTDARLRLAKENETIADELLHIAERRFAVGDIPVLDVNIAKASLSQTRSDLLVAEGALEHAALSLKGRLGMPRSAPLATSGDLAGAITAPDLSLLLDRAATSPQLRAIEARVRRAEADLQAARSLRWPDLALRAEESREEESRILLGGIHLSLPIFNRGQREQATATARLQRAQLELDVARQNAIAGAAGAFAEYKWRRTAAEELKTNALPLLADTVHLTERSYEAGEIDLAEVWVVRREALDARARYLDRLREAAESAIDLQARAGQFLP